MIPRGWYRFFAKLYGLFGHPRRLDYEGAKDAIRTPFLAHAYLEKWARYRANEPPEYNCILPQQVWDDRMLSDVGKHLWDCDDYSNAMIDPLRMHGYDCWNLVVLTEDSGHATLLIKHDPTQTLGTFGLWSRKNPSLQAIAQSFYPADRIKCIYIADRDWSVVGYGELDFKGNWYFTEVDE